ncbi:glycerol-3-phosphate 2-O-acyltransferase 6-like [Panicum miliaceum]|uniref:Glycerol-3-phosphate 2-O-acyltransferase 6-like n=1 Tax=Panicum miliaceum TaxID=4540 RepID=A0A3L6RG86_PANMI|nr:glycerol-3-phosphate 2-O-acyltransferase 6-like [Panicum miliaceum]
MSCPTLIFKLTFLFLGCQSETATPPMAADSHRCASVAAELEGTLLISGSLFPYFLLVALEAGGPLRAAVLLAVYPLAVLLGAAFSDDLPLLAMTFLSTAGLGIGDVAAVARATLPRFFLADLRRSAFRALARHAGERYVVTRLPRLLAEPFVREYLGADVRIVGAELRVVGRRFSETVASPGVAAGADRSLGPLVAVLGRDRIVDVGLCSGAAGDRQPAFLLVCQERRVVSTPEKAPATPLPRSEYPRPLVLHDGRLVRRPEPLACLAVFLWVPLGVFLSVTRLLLGFLPHGAGLLVAAAAGFRIRGELGGATGPAAGRRGTLFACNHQTLMDPVILSTVLRRKVTAVTYSLSGFSELIAPIPTVRLTRDRGRDSRAGARRPGGLPGGHDVPGAVPAPVQPAVRGDRRRGHADRRPRRRRHVPRLDGAGAQVAGLGLLPHEPGAVVRDPAPRAGGHHRRRRRRRVEPRHGERRPAHDRRRARVRVHRADAQGQVPDDRRPRRRRREVGGGVAELAVWCVTHATHAGRRGTRVVCGTWKQGLHFSLLSICCELVIVLGDTFSYKNKTGYFPANCIFLVG